MVKVSLLSALFGVLALCLSGCGGLFATNSTVTVHLKQNPNITNPTGQDLTTYELYVTREGTTPLVLTSTDTWASSTTNNSNVLDNYTATRSTTELTITFTTNSTKVPYYIFVSSPGTSGTNTIGVSVDVDGATGAVKAFAMPAGAVTQVSSTLYPTPSSTPGNAQITRNNATY